MILLDSNLIIYAVQPDYESLRVWLAGQALSASALSQLEVLGFERLSEDEREQFGRFFMAIRVWPISNAVVLQAIDLRQQRRMSLGDAVIAATALVQGIPLATRNVRDFRWIPNLVLIDPIAEA
jgi:toxin FitB